ncbi:MAG TPA: DUF1801 domain-containing protein [Rhizomicrobium sp.]
MSPVDAVFRAYPPAQRTKLKVLRKLILDTARKTEGVGPLEETLKWGQPSFLARSGTTIRIDADKSDPNRYAMFVNCRTDLVGRFRELYPKSFRYHGNREIAFDVREDPPEPALRHCIALALTYHAVKKRA